MASGLNKKSARLLLRLRRAGRLVTGRSLVIYAAAARSVSIRSFVVGRRAVMSWGLSLTCLCRSSGPEIAQNAPPARSTTDDSPDAS